ncbi:MAG: squalene/phytoene synthase family protein [Betaproteobacteria bacterium]
MGASAPAADHYENFPVASWLMPRSPRNPVRVVYAFARQADDFADEGNAPPNIRLLQLARFEGQLSRIEAGRPPTLRLFVELAPVVRQYGYPPLLRDLLSAFSQNVVEPRDPDFAELMDYCRRSANPVGRLVQYLFDAADARSLADSDAICLELQLINFARPVHGGVFRSRPILRKAD